MNKYEIPCVDDKSHILWPKALQLYTME